MRLLGLEHSYIDHTSWDTPSRNDDFTSIWCGRESLAPEDELIDGDIFEDLVF